jgi:uncharacterized membrane protein
MQLTKLEASIEINKPVRDVFEYTSDWRHWEEWRVGLSGLKPTTKIERGNNARYAYKSSIAGIKYNLETEVHYFKENVGWQGIVRKGLPHKMQWLFNSLGGKTKITYVLEYSPPGFLIGPILDFLFLRSSMQRMLEKTLNNLKFHFEGTIKSKA